MERAYAIWRAFQDRILAPLAALLLVGCTLLALVEIFRRYVIGTSFEWQQDAVVFFILSAVFLYFSIAQRRHAHLGVTMLPDALATLGPRARRVAEAIRLTALVFSFLFLIAVVWWGIPEIEDSLKYESRTESLAFPMWPFLTVLLASFGFMALTMFFQIWREIQLLRGRSVPAEPTDETSVLH